MLIPRDCLILVADGRKMLLLRQDGAADDAQLTVVHGEEQPNPADQDQKTDRAGQRPAIGSGGQASVDEPDYHQRTEDEFARHIAEHLNAMALKNQLGDLIVVAAGKTLGALRKQFSPQTQSHIIAEVDKVLTGYPTDRIAAMLQEVETA